MFAATEAPRTDSSVGAIPKCTACNSEDLVEDYARGDVICRNCGVVAVDRIIDMRPEKRIFEDTEDDPSRAQRVSEYVPNSLSTGIAATKPRTTANGTKAISGTGKIAQAHRKAQMLTSADRNISQGLGQLTQIAEQMALSTNIKDRGRELFSEFEQKRNQSKRLPREAVVAAVLYVACRESNVPRTLKEISRITGIDEKDIRKCYKVIDKTLPKSDKRETTAPENLISRLCNKLKLGIEVENASEMIAKRVAPSLEGKAPGSIAAASVLFAAKQLGEKRLDKDIANAASISTTTIRNVYKELEPHATAIWPEIRKK